MLLLRLFIKVYLTHNVFYPVGVDMIMLGKRCSKILCLPDVIAEKDENMFGCEILTAISRLRISRTSLSRTLFLIHQKVRLIRSVLYSPLLAILRHIRLQTNCYGFDQLSTRIAMQTASKKAEIKGALFKRLSLILMRANANAILCRGGHSAVGRAEIISSGAANFN